MNTLEYEEYINDYVLGSLEFSLARRLKATETAIKILANSTKIDTRNLIEKLYSQGITMMTVLGFFNKTYNLTEWINRYSKYLSNDVPEMTAVDLSQEQLDQVKQWVKQWGNNGFIDLDGDMTPYIVNGYVELNRYNEGKTIFYTMTEKAKNLK